MRRGVGGRGAVALVALVALAVLRAVPAGAASEGRSKPPSKADVSEAQKRANKAAARLAGAESELARAEQEVAELEARTSAARQRVSALEGEVRQLAVHQYVQGGTPEAWLADNDLGSAARGRAMLRYVTVGNAEAVEGFRVARSDLEEGQAALERRLAKQRSAVTGLRKDRTRITAELNRLAAAQRAYEAKVAAEKARAAARAAEKTKAARKVPGPSVLPPVRGGERGAERVIGSGSWVCPVQGPRAFSNDWGQPRSGGRRHQGNDIFARRGTPVVASVAGAVRPHSSSRGGISYYLRGDDGNTYFGTHLDGLSGVSGRVAAGTVIGYVGNTGNARGATPHLHFEIHPGGRGAVNPYSTLKRHC